MGSAFGLGLLKTLQVWLVFTTTTKLMGKLGNLTLLPQALEMQPPTPALGLSPSSSLSQEVQLLIFKLLYQVSVGSSLVSTESRTWVQFS